MAPDTAGRDGVSRPGPGSPGSAARLALAVVLLLGGAGAVTAGVLDQDAVPPSPQAAGTRAPDTPAPAASGPSTAGATRPAPGAAAPGVPAPGVPAPGATERQRPAPTEEPVADDAPAAPPVSVSIPSIDVRSELITVGLQADGTLEVPQPGPDYDKAAWFEGSPRPGDVGPAVIEGHVDSARNGPSVFYELGAVEVGDTVVVAREDGSEVTFTVYAVEAYPKSDFPTLAVYGNTEGPELRLITCGGSFDRSSGHYRDNTVVYARQMGAAA